MFQAQRMHFLLDMFLMAAILVFFEINRYHINGLHLFWDTLYNYKQCFQLPTSLAKFTLFIE